jgi:hypothetical protein
LIAISGSERPESASARAVIAKHFREHYDSAIDDKTVDALRAVRGERYWQHGWRAIVDTLRFMRRRSLSEGPKHLAKLQALVALEREFRPLSLDDLFETFVLGEPWRHWHPGGRERKLTRNASALARAVGRTMRRRNIELDPYLDRIVKAQGANSAWSFMVGVAQSERDLDGLWCATYVRFSATEHANPGLLSGLLKGAGVRRRDWVEGKLDFIVTDPVLGEHLVTLHNAVQLDAVALGRFSDALSKGNISVHRFTQLMMGGVTKSLPGDVFARLRWRKL